MSVAFLLLPTWCSIPLNEIVNKENDVVRIGALSRFHNANLSYALGFPALKFNLAASFNYTNSYAASQTSNILGPALSVNKTFLENKLNTTLGFSYNKSSGKAVNIEVTNVRMAANYSPWKKHSVNATVIQMFRKTNQQNVSPKLNEMTVSLGYAYSL